MSGLGPVAYLAPDADSYVHPWFAVLHRDITPGGEEHLALLFARPGVNATLTVANAEGTTDVVEIVEESCVPRDARRLMVERTAATVLVPMDAEAVLHDPKMGLAPAYRTDIDEVTSTLAGDADSLLIAAQVGRSDDGLLYPLGIVAPGTPVQEDAIQDKGAAAPTPGAPVPLAPAAPEPVSTPVRAALTPAKAGVAPSVAAPTFLKVRARELPVGDEHDATLAEILVATGEWFPTRARGVVSPWRDARSYGTQPFPFAVASEVYHGHRTPTPNPGSSWWGHSVGVVAVHHPTLTEDVAQRIAGGWGHSGFLVPAELGGGVVVHVNETDIPDEAVEVALTKRMVSQPVEVHGWVRTPSGDTRPWWPGVYLDAAGVTTDSAFIGSIYGAKSDTANLRDLLNVA